MAAAVEQSKPPNRLAEDEGYKNKTLLVTGATGFLGKVLIEKMLRTCPGVRKIYVLVRSKKGKHCHARMKEIFSGPLYDLLKKERGPDVLQKVVAVSGDVAEPDLGLSEEDRQTLADEVQIIYHLAATVRFDDPFKKAVLLNTRGTKLMLELAKRCKHLLVFAHISTAYCHPHEKVLYEKTYPGPANPHDIIKVVETLEDDVVTLMAVKLKKDCPNTYTYTKALAEALVNEQMDKLPVVILRPSVVIPIFQEPLPGWTDNFNGPGGLLVAAGKGVLRTMYCNSSGYADFIPVDVAANAMMLTVFDYMAYRERRIYNLTTSSKVRLTWGEMIEMGRRIIETKMPLNWVVWYPGGSMKSSRLYHNICVVLYHYIPALLADSLLILTGHKPVLWRIQQRITKGFELFEYYANNQWEFNIDSSLKGRELFNKTEREVYLVDEVGIDLQSLETYFYNCIHSARLYMLKESDATLPAARRHMKIMWFVDKMCKTLILFWLGHLLLKYVVYPLFGMVF